MEIIKYGYAEVNTRYRDLEGQMRQLEEEHCEKIYFEKLLEKNHP